MVTKYDIFEFAYTNRHPLKPIEVTKKFKKNESEYDNIHRMLKELVQEELLTKTNYGFQAKKSDKANLLYQVIFHCLRNGINYNNLLNPGIAKFLSRALQKRELNSRDANLHPITLKKYVNILYKNGLLLIISEKPLRVKVFYNVLLNNILFYFGYKHNIITGDTINYLEEIEKELIKFRRLKRENEDRYQQIIKDFEVSFVHHSLSLEGNPITINETKIILRDKLIPANLKSKDIDEVNSYQRALLQMLKDSQDRKPLTLQTILNYHYLAMQHEPDIAGRIRNIEVHLSGNPHFKITKAENIEKEFEELIKKYNDFIKKEKAELKEILAFAVYFHNEFQHIHPFEDGNSRTTRLITFHLLQSKDIPILDIPYGLLDEYLSYTKGLRIIKSLRLPHLKRCGLFGTLGCSKFNSILKDGVFSKNFDIREDKKLFSNLQKIILFNLKKINAMLNLPAG
ncbi:MAG: Fic family protein, partial [Nanoarchaeota archaeon]